MKKKKVLIFASLLLLALIFSGFPLSTYAAPGDLPLLSAGKHMFIWKGLDEWSTLPTQTQIQLNTKYQDAVNAGMDIGLVHIGWDQLEISDGVFDQAFLHAKLDEIVANGQQPFFTLCTLDSEEFSIPAYLRDPNDVRKLRSDILYMDNPEFLSKWHRLLDWVIPMLLEHNGFMISVGNEIDNRWKDIYEANGGGAAGKTAANAETPHIKAFINDSRSYIHSIPGATNLAVTATLSRGCATNYFIDNSFFPCIPEYISVCDITCWTFYGQVTTGTSSGDWTNEFLVESPSTVAAAINQLKVLSNGKQMLIQEAGYPSSSVNNSNTTLQTQWFDAMYNALETETSLRVIGVFMMVNPSETAIDLYVMPSIEGVPEPWYSRVIEMYKSYGFNSVLDGSSTPSWAPFVQKLSSLRSGGVTPMVYQASLDFSNTQGNNNWYYKYWNGSNYSNCTYKSDGSYWKGAQTYCRIYCGILVPDTSNEPAWAWVAPRAGNVTITSNGNVRKSETGGDGCYAMIYKNSAQLWSQLIGSYDTTGYPLNVSTTVNAGDTIYFRVNKNANINNDGVYYDPIITLN